MRTNPMIGAIAPTFNMPFVKASIPVTAPNPYGVKIAPAPAGYNPTGPKDPSEQKKMDQYGNYGAQDGPKVIIPQQNPIGPSAPLPGYTGPAADRDPNAFYSGAPTPPVEPAKSGISTPLLLGGVALLAYLIFKK